MEINSLQDSCCEGRSLEPDDIALRVIMKQLYHTIVCWLLPFALNIGPCITFPALLVFSTPDKCRCLLRWQRHVSTFLKELISFFKGAHNYLFIPGCGSLVQSHRVETGAGTRRWENSVVETVWKLLQKLYKLKRLKLKSLACARFIMYFYALCYNATVAATEVSRLRAPKRTNSKLLRAKHTKINVCDLTCFTKNECWILTDLKLTFSAMDVLF